jgi:C4-dicarboxylate-specific signal transduction histidine kinase
MSGHNSSTGIDITEEEQMRPKALDELEQLVEDQTAELAEADRRLLDEIEQLRMIAHPVVDEAGKVSRIVHVMSDITQRKRAEQAEAELKAQRLLCSRADRLRSLGQMAAGIAHELNQPLVGVRGLAEHLLIGMNRGWNLSEERVRNKLSLIIEQADRMSHIIQRVRMFARDAGKRESRFVQVNDVVQAALSMLGPQLRTRGIALDSELAEGIPLVRVNPMSLEEVVLNLVVNAADALAESTQQRAHSTPLRILVRTRISREKDQQRVQIQVIDQAGGIPVDLLPNVFEPFWTTKGPDRGTGLGLAICKDIVEQAGGTIGIESAVGRGTTVTVSLPAVTDLEEQS